MERLWSGEGCADNQDFEFVKYSDNGVPLYRKIVGGVVEMNNGSATHIIKHNDNSNNMVSNIDMFIAKALKPQKADTPRDAERKRMIREHLENGVVSVEQIAAELTLESMATDIQKRRPELSREQAFVAAMDGHPDLARIAIGN